MDAHGRLARIEGWDELRKWHIEQRQQQQWQQQQEQQEKKLTPFERSPPGKGWQRGHQPATWVLQAPC